MIVPSSRVLSQEVRGLGCLTVAEPNCSAYLMPVYVSGFPTPHLTVTALDLRSDFVSNERAT